MNVLAYTYLIGWSNFDKYYYGVRFAKGCNPSELMNTYFTSSKYVKRFIKENGIPDIIQIRRTFDNVNNARKWETKVLVKLDVMNDDRFLNRTNNISIDPESARIGGSKKKSDSFKYKLSKANKGKKLTEEQKSKISKSRKEGILNGTISNHPFTGKKLIDIMDSEKYAIFINNCKKSKRHDEYNPFYGKHHTKDTILRNKLLHIKVYSYEDYIIIGFNEKRKFKNKHKLNNSDIPCICNLFEFKNNYKDIIDNKIIIGELHV